MEENNQLAQSGTEINTVTMTNCSICRGKRIEKREAINRALGKGISYRDIEAMTNVAYRTIGNHAQHLPAIFREAKEKGILEQPIDVEQEFREQLAFAKELRIAAKEYLSDSGTGKITLIPRSDEVSIIYDDYSDTTPKGEPKKKTDSLDSLLERAKDGNIEPRRAVIKHVDIRSFALDAIRTADATIDKFAKIGGNYIKEAPLPPPANAATENDFAAFLLRRLIENMQFTEEEALEQIKIHEPEIYGLLTSGENEQASRKQF